MSDEESFVTWWANLILLSTLWPPGDPSTTVLSKPQTYASTPETLEWSYLLSDSTSFLKNSSFAVWSSQTRWFLWASNCCCCELTAAIISCRNRTGKLWHSQFSNLLYRSLCRNLTRAHMSTLSSWSSFIQVKAVITTLANGYTHMSLFSHEKSFLKHFKWPKAWSTGYKVAQKRCYAHSSIHSARTRWKYDSDMKN